jgi:hypothetical protein
MIISTKKLNQKAVYWAKSTQEGYGDYSYSAPVEIKCRWSTKTEIVKDSKGEEVISIAKVYVDRVLEVEGFLSLGELTVSTPATPASDNEAYAIIRIDEVPNVKATEKLVSVRL